MLFFTRFVVVFKVLLFLLLISTASHLQAQDGKALFQSNCASCHAVNKDLTGPALQGARERITDQALLYAWIRNSKKVLADGNSYFTELYATWNQVAMNSFPTLADEDINAILDYVDERAADLAKRDVVATASGGGMDTQAQSDADSSDVTMYLIILVVLLFVAYLFRKINFNLARAVAEKRGEEIEPLLPVYRDMRYWVLASVVAVVLLGIYVANQGMNVSLQQNYQPEQPIFFSHRVHAGINKIDCQYCHSTASQSKHALIPSVNVCMNCHKAINEYSGPALTTEEGKPVDGTAEIQKLYEYANFTPGKNWIPSDDNQPIAWMRVHNLPAHVKFNHAQHVTVGQVECTTCHGQIQEMDEVYQYNTLAMGWCINCHRQTEVQFAGNNYYTMYKDLHKQIAEGTLERVTVEQIGGLECQKCHH